MELESSEHVFWGCEKAHEIWTISGNSFETPRVNFPKFKDLIWQLKFEQRVKNDILELIIMVSEQTQRSSNNTHTRDCNNHEKKREKSSNRKYISSRIQLIMITE